MRKWSKKHSKKKWFYIKSFMKSEKTFFRSSKNTLFGYSWNFPKIWLQWKSQFNQPIWSVTTSMQPNLFISSFKFPFSKISSSAFQRRASQKRNPQNRGLLFRSNFQFRSARQEKVAPKVSKCREKKIQMTSTFFGEYVRKIKEEKR